MAVSLRLSFTSWVFVDEVDEREDADPAEISERLDQFQWFVQWDDCFDKDHLANPGQDIVLHLFVEDCHIWIVADCAHLQTEVTSLPEVTFDICFHVLAVDLHNLRYDLLLAWFLLEFFFENLTLDDKSGIVLFRVFIENLLDFVRSEDFVIVISFTLALIEPRHGCGLWSCHNMLIALEIRSFRFQVVIWTCELSLCGWR